MLKLRPLLLIAALLLAGILAGAAAAGTYSGNPQSQIFHSSNCRHFNCKACTVEFKSRDEALSRGYRPCKVCKP